MNLTSSQAKGLVVGCVAGAAVLSSVESLATGTLPSVRVAVGGVIAGAVLYALADLAPAVSGAFALVLIAGAVFTNGVAVARIVTNATK